MKKRHNVNFYVPKKDQDQYEDVLTAISQGNKSKYILDLIKKDFIFRGLMKSDGTFDQLGIAMTRATPRQIQMECDRRGWDVQIPLKDRGR